MDLITKLKHKYNATEVLSRDEAFLYAAKHGLYPINAISCGSFLKTNGWTRKVIMRDRVNHIYYIKLR